MTLIEDKSNKYSDHYKFSNVPIGISPDAWQEGKSQQDKEIADDESSCFWIHIDSPFLLLLYISGRENSICDFYGCQITQGRFTRSVQSLDEPPLRVYPLFLLRA